MSVPSTRTFGLLLVAVLALGAPAGSPLSAFRSRDIRGILFAASSQPAAQARPADPTVIRSRLVTIDLGALQAARPVDPGAAAGPSLLINLFDDLAYNAVVDRIDPAVGGFTWVGHIPGHDLSTVTLATVDGVVAGGIVMPEAAYTIRYVGGGVHEVAQIDQANFLPEANPIAVSVGRTAAAAAPRDPAAAGDSGATIDVMVLYTPAAAAEAGGTSGIRALINQGVSDANTSYANSGITQRLNAVYVGEVEYTESPYVSGDTNTGMERDLDNLQGGAGALSGVAGLRDGYGADLVSLIIRRATDWCGMGYMMDSVGLYFERYAFNVVDRSCIPGFTLAHELGHNMGAQHDWYMDNSTTPYSYAHGYVDTRNRFRTVMAYNFACTKDLGFSCTRLLYWSNPAIMSPGANGSAPMGIPGGTKTDCPTGDASNMSCDADDHQALNNTAFTVANFRQAASPSGPAITSQPGSQTVTAGSTATFAASASGNPSPTVRWQVSTDGGGSWNDIGGATAATYALVAGFGDSGKQYRAVFTNFMGSAATSAATLTVRTPPSITLHPSDATARAGGSVSFSAAASSSPAPTVQWQISTNGGATFTDLTGATATTYTFVAAAADHNNRYRAVFTSDGGSTPTNAATLTISGQITLDPSPLLFAASKNGAGRAIAFVTPAQTVSVSGISTAWTATAGQAWLQVTGGSGTGAGQFTVSIVNPADIIAGSTLLSGTITVSTLTTPASSASIPVTLRISLPGTTGAPFGAFDTPTDGTAGMQGSFAVTGWALDDLGIDHVEIWRDLVAGEDPAHAYTTDPSHPAYGKVFIANPLFVQGARPDVEAAYPTFPQSYRSGWGYLLLSWGLEGQGNGPYTLYAFAFDQEGHATTLGTKTISVDNAHASKPFGSIDTPAYGETTSGSFFNFGWALTPLGSASCRIDNGGVQVSIDSLPLATAMYGDARSDIAAAFPAFLNSTNASGAYLVDTRQLSNGQHQIGWLVTDSCGRQDGIGSRFFTVLNGGGGARPAVDAGATKARPPSVSADAISVRHGGEVWQAVWPNRGGDRVVEIVQDGRVDIALPHRRSGTFRGYQMVNGQHRPLPLGSSLDTGEGVYYWQPAAGFLGSFDLLFVTPDEAAVAVRVIVGPAVRMAIDVPESDRTVSGPFTVEGWAVDLASENGSGIDTVHVWAYPLDGSAPIWLGVADRGDPRPDVGDVYGAAFSESSYSLNVGNLAPGSYDVVVYPHRARTNAFEGAQIVRIAVR
ncbi:MAG: M12 family metallo-peptidase [Acidobacteria bacterium]|nr:M12 family metallo-peptidase [Acidobacteriota bacterium]